MTFARESLNINIEESPAIGCESVEGDRAFERSLNTLFETLAGMDEEAGIAARRELLDAISVCFDLCPVVSGIETMRPSGLNKRRVKSLKALRTLMLELQCMPLGSQRLDSRLKQLPWAMRRYCEFNDGLKISPYEAAA